MRWANRSTASGSSLAPSDGLGEQRDAADRGLQLVADVRDEVAADLLDPPGVGVVLGEDQHVRDRDRRDPHPHDDARRGVRAAGQVELGLADHAVAAHLPREVAQLVVDELAVAHQPVAHGGRRGVDDGVARVDDHGDRAQHGQHVADTAGQRWLRGLGAWAPLRSDHRVAATATAPMTRPAAPPSIAASVGSTRSGYGACRRVPADAAAPERRLLQKFTSGASRVHPGVPQCRGRPPRPLPPHRNPGGHPVMRKAFHEELDRVAETLVEMTHLASSAMSRATTALLDADIHLADSVIAADAEIDARRAELDLMSFDLLARQQPVATDLRVIVTSMRMSSDLERMGDLARHVAKVARLRYPESAVPAELRATILQMGQVAERIVEKAGVGHRRPRRRGRPPDRARRRRDGRPAPRAVRPGDRRQLAARHRGRGRHHPAGPLLRAVRGPRRQRRPPGHLARHGRVRPGQRGQPRGRRGRRRTPCTDARPGRTGLFAGRRPV